MRILGFLVVVSTLSLVSCSDEYPQLITKYEAKWELNLVENYPSSIQFPNNLLSTYKLINTGNHLLVVSNLLTDGVVTKVSYEGEVVDDLILSGVGYSAAVTLNRSKEVMILYQNQQSKDQIDKYDANLNKLATTMLDFGTGFQTTMALGESAIFKHMHKNSKDVLASYSFDGSLLWEAPFYDLGCGGSHIKLLFNDRSLSVVAESYPDSIKLSQLDMATGRVQWNKLLMKQSVLPESGLISSAWTTLGKLALLGTSQSGERIGVAFYNKKVESKFMNLDLTYGTSITRVLPTNDGGLLLGLVSDVSLESVNFKLLKLDSEGNPGWIGSFYYPGYDYIADMVELNDGTIIVLSGKGYLMALAPVYN